MSRRTPPAWVTEGNEDGARLVDVAAEEATERFNVPSRVAVTELRVPLQAPPEPLRPAPHPPQEGDGGWLRRLTPKRSRWPDVVRFDEKLERLDRRRAEVGETVAQLEQELNDERRRHVQALAVWQLDGGERPVSNVAAIEAALEQARADLDSTGIAENNILREKVDYVAENRARLVREAAAQRQAAITALREAIELVEQNRAAAVEALSTEAWARWYPAEIASASDLNSSYMRGGRNSKKVPDIRTLTSAASVVAWLQHDADWIDGALAEIEERLIPNVRREAVWMHSPEGQQAVACEVERVRQEDHQRGVHQAEWGD